MIQRVEGGLTYTQTFDAENRLISVTVSGQTTQFVYDGDGNLVKKIKPDGSRTLYVGGIYEVDKNSGGTVARTVTYYPAGGAMRINGTLYYVLKDHLGSASVVTDASGATVGEDRFGPFGQTRFTTGTMFTDKLYTGQRQIAELGIYHYGARFYSPYINRFLSADTIVPGYANPQSLNRYSYVLNNPLKLTDPTGHKCVGEAEECEDEDGNPINGAGGLGNGSLPINDPNWDDKDRVDRAQEVWNALCHAGGWWGSGCPSEQDLVTWLLYEEGGTLTLEYQRNMARGMRYRFAYFGNTDESFIVQLSAFTAFFNPDSDGDFDQSDWETLTNPSYDLSGASSIVQAIYKSEIKASDGHYMYWWDETEVVATRGKWPGRLGVDYFQTATVRGLPFYFTGISNIRDCAMKGTNCK